MATRTKSGGHARKQKVRTKPQFSAKRHLLPIFGGIAVMLLAVAALNSQLLLARVQFHFVKPPAITVEAVNTVSPDPEAAPQILIPSINVQAPIVLEPKTDESSIQLALRDGVAHYGTTSLPGMNGNIVLLGHSSGAAWRPGNYKYVFTLLEKLQKEDTIIVDYKGTRYIYEVVSTKTVPPTDISVLSQSTEPKLTLITCTPVGTDKNRFIVEARQVSPKYDLSTLPAAPLSGMPANQVLPSN